MTLSYGVPVLVPGSPVMTELRSRFGPEAVHLHDGIPPEAIQAFASIVDVDRTRIVQKVRSIHDWSMIGKTTAEFFRKIIAERFTAHSPGRR